MFLLCLAGILITEFEQRRLKTRAKHRRRRLQRNMILINMMEEDRRAERNRQTKQQVSLTSINNQLVECVMLSYELAYVGELQQTVKNMYCLCFRRCQVTKGSYAEKGKELQPEELNSPQFGPVGIRENKGSRNVMFQELQKSLRSERDYSLALPDLPPRRCGGHRPLKSTRGQNANTKKTGGDRHPAEFPAAPQQSREYNVVDIDQD